MVGTGTSSRSTRGNANTRPRDAKAAGPMNQQGVRLKPAYPPVYYFSRKYPTKQIRTNDLPPEPNAVGIYSPWAMIWGCLFAIVPLAYIYIFLILLRELCVNFPDISFFFQHYLPIFYRVIELMQQSSKLVEAWCILEAIFYVGLKLHIWRLERQDPLEASLSSAPLMDPKERGILWDRMMEAEREDPAALISGWFFDQDIQKISRYDVREFVTWSMFEGRNQEHLTSEELEQLEGFVQQLEYRISVHWYGIREESEEENIDHSDTRAPISDLQGGIAGENGNHQRSVPRKRFRFPELEQNSPPSFFSDLYESYRRSYEKYRTMMENSDFHPMEDFWKFMATTTQQIIEAEENAVATAQQTAESAMATATQTAESAMATAQQTATQMYENIIQPVGQTLIQPGSNMEQQLAAFSQATHAQLISAFNSVKGMKERLETAKFLSTRRKIIRQQLKSYREMLHRLRAMSSEVPSKQMAILMRRITESNDALERLEHRARDAYAKATGYARKNLLFPSHEPQRYAKYSSDPLLGVSTFPLGFHLLILGATEVPLRILMARRGFERETVGSISYYFHPGPLPLPEYDEGDGGEDTDESTNTPIIFVHGIGIGLIAYLPLIDALLKLGRPIFLPEIPYVSGFRPWQGSSSVLGPASVCSTMTAMLATHGYLKGTFAGHSYGTTWLSYMCKYAPTVVAALLFLDPICFCLHIPRLTKKFVYHRPDPGSVSYIVRSDIIVNWTIQRSFPWAWIVLFVEQIHVPCSVFLSDMDALVPAEKVEVYLRSRGSTMIDFKPGLDKTHFSSGDGINGCIFRGHGHGDWTTYPTHTVPVIADCLQVLCERAEGVSQQ